MGFMGNGITNCYRDEVDKFISITVLRRVVLSLLPLASVDLEPPRDILTVLQRALAKRGVDREDAELVITAFSRNESILPALYRVPMRLKEISLTGFRAFAKTTTVDLSADCTILVGKNGQGKTSLLDGLFWALTGQLERIGEDDSLVSLYSETGTASVSLTLSDGGKIWSFGGASTESERAWFVDWVVGLSSKVRCIVVTRLCWPCQRSRARNARRRALLRWGAAYICNRTPFETSSAPTRTIQGSGWWRTCVVSVEQRNCRRLFSESAKLGVRQQTNCGRICVRGSSASVGFRSVLPGLAR